jgi:hypothetical protein
MKNQGILLVAFGEPHLGLAEVAFGRKSILEGLPVHVLTDQPLKRCGRGPSGWTFSSFPEFDWTHNRWVRTNACLYTPFQRTLMLDVDQVVARPGIRKFFDLRGPLVLNATDKSWSPGDKVYRIYKEAFLKFGVRLPVTVYNGSFLLWDSCEIARQFFRQWHENWKALGMGRDMAALACAVKQAGISVTEVPAGWYAGNMREQRGAIIQHDFGDRFRLMYGLPRCPENKPYDEGRSQTDWQFVPLSENDYANPQLQ